VQTEALCLRFVSIHACALRVMTCNYANCRSLSLLSLKSAQSYELIILTGFFHCLCDILNLNKGAQQSTFISRERDPKKKIYATRNKFIVR
jgi:hypothetical protein